jgi:hypothetical protein
LFDYNSVHRKSTLLSSLTTKSLLKVRFSDTITGFSLEVYPDISIPLSSIPVSVASTVIPCEALIVNV